MIDLRLPLKITAHDEAFGIKDAAGLTAAYVYFDDGCEIRRGVRKRLTRDSAREVAKTIARALTVRIAGQDGS